MTMQAINSNEKSLIEKFAEHLPASEKRDLLVDLGVAVVSEFASDRSWLIFDIPGYVRPQYEGQHAFNVEGKILDEDGGVASVILYADANNRLYELEFIRWDAKEIIGLKWDTLELYGL